MWLAGAATLAGVAVVLGAVCWAVFELVEWVIRHGQM